MPIYPSPPLQRSEMSCSRRLSDGTWEAPKRCPADLDPMGDHAVGCHFGPSLIGRHNHVTNLWKKHLEHQKWVCDSEPKLDASRFRPADVLARYWSNLRDCAFDWQIVHPLCKTVLQKLESNLTDIDSFDPLTFVNVNPDYAIVDAEDDKRKKASDRCAAANIDFTPLVADTFGGFGTEAIKAMRILYGRITASDVASVPRQ